MNGSVNVPGASAADLAKVRKTAEDAATAASNAATAAADAKKLAEEAKEAAEAGGGPGGCVLKITFENVFAGQVYTVESAAGESYTGTVPEDLQVDVSVQNCNTAYTVKASTAAGDQYTTSVTTGAYFGQYPVTLSAFTASIVVTARAGAAVKAVSGGHTYTGTAASNGKATVTVKQPGTYTVSATLDGKASNITSVAATANGGSYTATVKFIVLTVTVDSGSAVTVSKSGVTLNGNSNGTAVFVLPSTGTWTVTATKDGKTASGSVNASGYADYSLALTYVSTTLNANSWATIKDVSDADQGANYWDVGDTKSITLNGKAGNTTFSNLAVDVFIIGFNHNSSREGAHKIHFQIGKIGGKLVALCDSKYNSQGGSGDFVMNTSNTNAGGWNGSHMRKTILGSDATPSAPRANTLLAAMPADLRAVMKPITKYSDNTGGGSDTASYVTATTDYLPMLAEFEYHGARTWANSAEKNFQLQYEYYKAGNSKVHYKHNATGTAASVFCRSVRADYSIYFCLVNTDGSASNHGAHWSGGVAPGFAA